MNDRISFLLVAKNHYMLEIAKYNKRIDKESDKLFAMQKDEGNNSVKQRAKVRTRLSQMADAREVINKKVAEINNWIEELKRSECLMESFLENVARRHKEGKKLSEGDIDFLIGVANSSVKLSESNARLREALGFYANKKNWIRNEFDIVMLSQIESDSGDKARQVLGGAID